MKVSHERGFSLVELLIAVTIFAVAVVSLMYLAAIGQRAARTQPEATDLHQRARVAADKLQRDLAMAGAGPLHSSLDRPIAAYVPPIVPARTGIRLADPELTAFPDRLTVLYVSDGGWQASLMTTMATPSSGLLVDTTRKGCPAAGVCGFEEGMQALVFDSRALGAGHDVFTITGATNELTHDAPNLSFSHAYEAGAVVTPIVQRVYYFDRAGRRLMLYDGYQSDLPIVDHVVDVSFEYFVDGGPDLVPIALAQLTDGPAQGVSPNQFDEDLLRVAMVRVTLRLEAGADEVRGDGALFSRRGHSASAYSFVPDYQVTFDVALRNLGRAR